MKPLSHTSSHVIHCKYKNIDYSHLKECETKRDNVTKIIESKYNFNILNLLSVLLQLFRYIMTSEFTLAPTETFFQKNYYFGLEPSNIVMFEQRMIPAVTFDGKVILQGKGKIAMAPGRCTSAPSRHKYL